MGKKRRQKKRKSPKSVPAADGLFLKGMLLLDKLLDELRNLFS